MRGPPEKSIMVNGTQKAIFGTRNSYNMVQAAQESAQKSQNLLYHISLKRFFPEVVIIALKGLPIADI